MIAISRRWTLVLVWALMVATVPTLCRADLASDAAAMAPLRQQVQAMRADKPEEAIALIRQFQTEQGAAMQPTTLAGLDYLIAQIYNDNLKAPDKALAVLDAGLKRPEIKTMYLTLITYKRSVLTTALRDVEAMELFKTELPNYMAEPINDFAYLRGTLWFYGLSARRASKTGEFVTTLRSIMAKQPELVAYPVVGFEVVKHMLEQPGKEAEALSWAKVCWMTCDFDEKTLGEATSLLQKAWVTKNTNTAQSTAFLKALQDPQAPNPLQEVPLPEMDKTRMRELLQSLPASSLHGRITLHLMLGEPGEAMLMARRALLSDPSGQANAAALEMARVFKATDLNLVRANAFLKYYQSNEGTNPLEEFFKQHPVGAK